MADITLLDKIKKNIADSKKAEQDIAKDSTQEVIMNSLLEQNVILKQLLKNSNAIYNINRLTNSFITLSFDLTTTSQKVYVADKDRSITLLHAGLATEGAGDLLWGASGVSLQSGYPLIVGDVYTFFIERHTEIYALSSTTATLHILVY